MNSWSFIVMKQESKRLRGMEHFWADDNIAVEHSLCRITVISCSCLQPNAQEFSITETAICSSTNVDPYAKLF
jgi:predicted signal transduction protein with EAL and GGDEF domain